MSSETNMRLFRMRKNILEMLRDRGYMVLEEEIEIDYNQFKEKFGDSADREEISVNKFKKDDHTDQIYVFFPNDEKVGVKHIKHYIDRMKSENVSRAILVVMHNLTPMAKKSVQEVSQSCRLEVFQEAELLVNINKHMLVPEHQVLTNEEKKALLQKYALKETQLPRILLTDPIARYHGLERGQVVKIIRPSETAGKYVTYRYVV